MIIKWNRYWAEGAATGALHTPLHSHCHPRTAFAGFPFRRIHSQGDTTMYTMRLTLCCLLCCRVLGSSSFEHAFASSPSLGDLLKWMLLPSWLSFLHIYLTSFLHTRGEETSIALRPCAEPTTLANTREHSSSALYVNAFSIYANESPHNDCKWECKNASSNLSFPALLVLLFLLSSPLYAAISSMNLTHISRD